MTDPRDDRPCTVDDCDRPLHVKSRGLCSPHYQQWLRGRQGFAKVKRPVMERDDQGRKRCTRCEGWKPEADFARSAGKKDGLQAHCRACKAAIYREQRDVVRDERRLWRFGLTREAFDAMFESQGRRCAICRRTDTGGNRYWAVDHDHACCPGSNSRARTCGKCVRGILCIPCNQGIGQLRDDVSILAAAIDYLESSRVRDAAA